MKKKFSVAGLVFVALCTMAATIQWYSQQPATTALTDSMVIAVERPVPHGYLSTTLASLKGYTGTNTVLVSSNVYTTNLYTTNLYSSNIFTTNLFSTNVYTTNLYSSNAFITNITVNNITSQTNYFTDLTVESNVTFNGKVTINNITVTNGITNLNLTANTIVKADANSALASVPNGSGALTNDGSGNFGWSALSGGDQVWTNDGSAVRLISGDIPPALQIYYDYSTNSQTVSIDIESFWPGFDAYSEATLDALTQSEDSSVARLNLYAKTTNGMARALSFVTDATGASNPIDYYSNLFLAFSVGNAGIVTAVSYVSTEQSWSGPTNEISVGEWTYTANTPCAVTNIAQYAAGVGNGALLSITNASSSNITFTVHSPIQIPYGETSRSYTITNGNTFFGSFRKGAHGSVFVPRGFYKP